MVVGGMGIPWESHGNPQLKGSSQGTYCARHEMSSIMSSIHHHICRGLSLFVTLTGEDYRLLSLLFSSAHNALHGARVQEQPSAQARLDGVHLMALQVTSAGPTTCATKSNRGRGICAFGASASATWNDLIWGDQL